MIANHRKKHRVIVRLAFLGTAFLTIAAAGILGKIVQTENTIKNKTYPSTYADSVPIGLMTKDEMQDLFRETESRLRKTTISIRYRNEYVATFSAELLDLHLNTNDVYEQAHLVGRSPHFPSRLIQRISAVFGLQQYRFPVRVVYNKALIRDKIAFFADSYNIPPQNALFSFENGRVISFRKEEAGRRILGDRLFKEMEDTVRAQKTAPGSRILELRDETVRPEITLAKANQFGIEELVGEGESNYTHSIPGRIHNVILAASKFNGVLIPPGQTLSFNDTVGDISARTGYQPAYIIKEGRTVLGDGGGVCQVSTTLFRAALNSGLPIIEQHPHAYRVSYYENGSKPGLDATVFAPGVDLKIQNNTPSYILIQTQVEEEPMILRFKLYGKRDGRKVELSTPILYNVAPPPPDLYQDDPTMKKGETKQVDFAAWGGNASFSYKVTKNDTEVLFEKKFVSAYKPWQAVYLVGTAD